MWIKMLPEQRGLYWYRDTKMVEQDKATVVEVTKLSCMKVFYFIGDESYHDQAYVHALGGEFWDVSLCLPAIATVVSTGNQS